MSKPNLSENINISMACIDNKGESNLNNAKYGFCSNT
jgi:hypothetical protein